jgi:hypothetical protein
MIIDTTTTASARSLRAEVMTSDFELTYIVQSGSSLQGRVMGAWGTGLYSGDFAVDLGDDRRSRTAAAGRGGACRRDLLSRAVRPVDDDHAIFWLVLADQLEKRGIFSRRVRETALAIIDDRENAPAMQALGMNPADIRKRAGKLAELPCPPRGSA